MKKLTITVAFILAMLTSQAQSNQVEQYCELVAIVNNNVSFRIDFGENDRFLSDNQQTRDTQEKLNKYKSVIQAINYLGYNGWQLISTFPISGTEYHFYFKKLVPKASINQNTPF